MNKVYQDFMTEIIQEIVTEDPDFKGYQIEKQSRFNSLVKEGKIRIIPDIVVKTVNEEYPLIIDAKYKRDKSNADYYQIIAYSLALPNCKSFFLSTPNLKKAH